MPWWRSATLYRRCRAASLYRTEIRREGVPGTDTLHASAQQLPESHSHSLLKTLYLYWAWKCTLRPLS